MFAEIIVQRLIIKENFKDVFGGHIVFLHSGERDHVAALLTLKAKWFATLTKTMGIMMNNVVLMFSPADEKTP